MFRRIATYTLLAACLAVTGCSSTKVLQPNLMSAPEGKKNISGTLAIEGSKVKGKQLTANPGLVSLTVVYGDALLESIKHSLSGRFDNIVIVESPKVNRPGFRRGSVV